MDLTQAIESYIRMPKTGALMISGGWGKGKTYHIDHVVIPKLKNDNNYKPIKVSLFGIQNINDISERIIEEYINSYPDALPKDKKQKLAFLWHKHVKRYKEGFDKITSINDTADAINKAGTFILSSIGLFKYSVPKEKTIIFLDDIERAIHNIDITLLLGYINGLVEQQGYNVIVIANHDHISSTVKDKGNTKDNKIEFEEKVDGESIEFEEKVISKSIEFLPDIKQIFSKIIKESSSVPSFETFMSQNDCYEIINKDNLNLKDCCWRDDLENIRTIKFAVSHFYEAFTLLENNKNEDYYTPFLKSLWALTFGLSLYYKKGLLFYKDRDEYCSYISFPKLKLDLDLDFNHAEKKEDKEKPRSKNETIDELYTLFIKKRQLSALVVPELFDFILGGIPLTRDALLKHYKAYVEYERKNTIQPEYALLGKMINEKFSFTDEEMPEKLLKLLQYCEKGAYTNLIDYMNASYFLLSYDTLIKKDRSAIEGMIKNGISKMVDNSCSISINGLSYYENEIPTICKDLFKYGIQKIKTKKDKEDNKRDELAIKMFEENLGDFVHKLVIQVGDATPPDYIQIPILSKIPRPIIVAKVGSITPNEVFILRYMIYSRFVGSRPNESLYEEINFLENLKEAIDNRLSGEKKLYSDYCLSEMVPTIEKAIKNIESVARIN